MNTLRLVAAASLFLSGPAIMSSSIAAAESLPRDVPIVRPTPVYPVRPAAGTIIINGQRIAIRAYLYNDLSPAPNVRLAGLGTLLLTFESLDGRPVPFTIQTVTAEVSQGRARWRGTLPPFADPLALFRGPTWGTEGIRTFKAGSRVNINVTVRAGGREQRTTLRNVVVAELE